MVFLGNSNKTKLLTAIKFEFCCLNFKTTHEKKKKQFANVNRVLSSDYSPNKKYHMNNFN